MSQPSVASFFNTRKRAAADEISNTRNKKSNVNGEKTNSAKRTTRSLSKDQDFLKGISTSFSSTKSRNGIKRIGASNISDIKLKSLKNIEDDDECFKKKELKLVQFVKKGLLSPKNLTPQKDAFSSNENAKNSESTPTKNATKEQLKNLVKKELNFDEVKTKVSRSAKLQELKASLNRLQELEKTRKAQEEKNNRLRNGETSTKKKPEGLISLKEFKTIDVEVLTSPIKSFKTPVKMCPPIDKHGLMSPKSATPKRLLFSPTKDGSPSKIVQPPAYQRFLNLAQSTKSSSLLLPYKYRYLIEVFKAVDSVCAMLFNRKEVITFKKLKPAVQRMLRKNLYESHLAQIKLLFPEAFYFYQMKMRNYGSISKQDYFQLVIAPNVGDINHKMTLIDEDDVLKSAQSSTMNPQIMTERQQKFQNILLEKVKDEHDKFLKTLSPPLEIPKNKVVRWHPEFDLENCADIELGNLPQPPNVEKYSSAKDILSTARNLFNCATPAERAMARFDSKTDTEKEQIYADSGKILAAVAAEDDLLKGKTSSNNTTEPPTATLLKGVPQSLLEKIRAKQAAKALDAMTRRPSQDREATKYSRLPELARHLRNVFITEKKGVLPMEIVIKKIENSYRTTLTHKEIEIHLQLIAKECPKWIAFHDIRKTVYLKMQKEKDLSKIIEHLEKIANDKSK